MLRGRFSVYYLLSTCQQVCWINQPAANGHLWWLDCVNSNPQIVVTSSFLYLFGIWSFRWSIFNPDFLDLSYPLYFPVELFLEWVSTSHRSPRRWFPAGLRRFHAPPVYSIYRDKWDRAVKWFIIHIHRYTDILYTYSYLCIYIVTISIYYICVCVCAPHALICRALED